MKNTILLIIVVIAIGILAFSNERRTEKKVIFPNESRTVKKVIFSKNAPEAIGPYSQAVLAGNTIYLSGQIAINPETKQMITDDIKKETEQVMANIKAVLEEAGFQLKDIVSTTIYLTNMENYPIVNNIYGSYFKGIFPARATVQVAQLPKKANIEISVIAVK